MVNSSGGSTEPFLIPQAVSDQLSIISFLLVKQRYFFLRLIADR
jgi:hypothetical protein